VITDQPLAYAQTVARESAEVFYPGRSQRPGEACVAYWTYPDPLPSGCRTDAVGTHIWRKHPFTVRRRLADAMNVYQRLDDAAGPVMLACLVAVALSLVRRTPRRASRLRLDAAWFAVIGLVLTVAAIATSDFSYRYTLPLYSTVPIAAALAVTAIVRGRAK
jgi:hypothetical protein